VSPRPFEPGEVRQLAHPRPGHFDLGTGYHGDVWLDLDALFLRPDALRPHLRVLAGHLRQHRIEAICGPMEGGALLAFALADLLGTAFLPAYRRSGPGNADLAGYRLPAVSGGLSGWRVAVVDDAVNAGTAVLSCSRQLRDAGAVPVAVAALLALGDAPAIVAAAMSVPFYAAGSILSRAWRADECPLCASGAPLADPASAD
jgi:orotate phosphoribosyltransferase